MSDLSLTGAQKSSLRGRGQLLEPRLKVGKEGASQATCTELVALLKAHELVKVRFVSGEDRVKRAALCDQLAEMTHCACVGAVGHTALFYRPREAQ